MKLVAGQVWAQRASSQCCFLPARQRLHCQRSDRRPEAVRASSHNQRSVGGQRQQCSGTHPLAWRRAPCPSRLHEVGQLSSGGSGGGRSQPVEAFVCCVAVLSLSSLTPSWVAAPPSRRLPSAVCQPHTLTTMLVRRVLGCGGPGRRWSSPVKGCTISGSKHRLLCVLLVHLLLAALPAARGQQFIEQLLLRPLEDGNVLTHAQFTVSTHGCIHCRPPQPPASQPLLP